MTTQPLDAVVAYDPKGNSYTVTLRRPTRADAEIAYLRAVRPALATKIERLSEHFPELASRARKAGFLILAGKVTLAQPGTVQASNGRYHRTATVLAWVQSEWSSRTTYILTRGELGVVICNCRDAQPEVGEQGAPRSRVAPHTCRHIIAAALFT
jgi:hypothetical protein